MGLDLAIAFSKRASVVEMGFQHVATMIVIIIIAFGRTSRIEDLSGAGLGSGRNAVHLLAVLQAGSMRH